MQHSTLGFLTLNLQPLVTIAAVSDEGFRSVGERLHKAEIHVIAQPGMRDRLFSMGLESVDDRSLVEIKLLIKSFVQRYAALTGSV
jgi:hypothetical protein